MSERNQIKPRKCNRCMKEVVGKANKLKEHVKECAAPKGLLTIK